MTDILGTEFNEVLIGTDDDDIIIGYAGYDTLDGGEGSDTYIVNAGDFQNRFVDFYQDSGTSGTDVILAAEAGVIIGIGDGFNYASSGIEIIDGLNGSTISGDNDRQVWDFTDVEIRGVDVLFGMGGHDEIRGSNGNDGIDGGTGHDILHGGNGDDTIVGGEGHDQLYGENGRDNLEGGEGNDRLFGGDSRDILNGNAGFDYLDGGEGSDIYYVGLDNAGFVDEYNDTGTSGRDIIRALDDGTVIGLIDGFGPDNGIEVISSFRHTDVTIGGTNDAETWDFSGTIIRGIRWINALDGHDNVTGNAQRNRIDGGDGNDFIDGGAGNDVLVGGNGFDIIVGGEGRDRIDGGAGNDHLDGGEGADIYLYHADVNGGFDEIRDTGTDDGRDIMLAAADNVQIGLSMVFSLANNGIEIISSGRHANVTIEGQDIGNNWDFTDISLFRIAAINSGDGMDIVQGNSRRNIINGEAGHDQLYGGEGRDILSGGDDSDFLFGENGADQLFGDAGNDILTGGRGRDTLTGGEGFDIFAFGPDSGRDVVTDFNIAADLIDLRAYDGELTYEDLRFVQGSRGLFIFMGDNRVLLENVFLDSLSAELFIFPELETPAQEEAPVDEDMMIDGGSGSDTLEGGSGNDTINASHGDDTIIGNAGNDYLDGGNGNDTLFGGDGNDEVIGSHGNDNLFGGDGDDLLDGGNNEDRLEGGAGNDTLIGFNGRDILIGGAGDDRLDGGNDDDVLDGGDGDDYLSGFNGRDTLDGGAGDDTLIGYNDDDVLTGGAGNDVLFGGFGNDRFIFGENSGNDTIDDYEDGRDILEFRDLVDDFSELTITQDGDNAIISSANGTVTLLDTDASLLDASDFFFG